MFSFAFTFLISLHLVCYQAMAQSTCMFALLGCPGGFASDDCVEQYCKYDCAPKCCALSTLSDIRSCLGDSTPTPTDQNYVACGTAIRIISACQTIIPTFSAASSGFLDRSSECGKFELGAEYFQGTCNGNGFHCASSFRGYSVHSS